MGNLFYKPLWYGIILHVFEIFLPISADNTIDTNLNNGAFDCPPILAAMRKVVGSDFSHGHQV